MFKKHCLLGAMLTLLVATCSVLLVFPAFAQHIDNETGQYDRTAFFVQPVGQSFVAVAPEVDSIQVGFSVANSGFPNELVDAFLYEGAGYDGTLVASGTITLPENLPDSSEPPGQVIGLGLESVSLQVGQSYTFAVAVRNSFYRNAIIYDSATFGGDSYTDGRMLHGSASSSEPHPEDDVRFLITGSNDVIFSDDFEPLPRFFLDPNGVTIRCPIAEVGEQGAVNGVVYTKRTRDQITSENASSTCTSGVADISGLFAEDEHFNADIGHWDTSAVTNMSWVFNYELCHLCFSDFNQDIGDWDTSAVTDMSGLFYGVKQFNQDISSWDTSSVVNMRYMFYNAESFNQPLGAWNTQSVTDMTAMFVWAGAFNQPIDSWDVSSVTSMAAMFSLTPSFNQPLNSWNTSSVVDMATMFRAANAFNQPIGNWDTSSVEIMRQMFRSAGAFNQDIGSWDTGSVTDLSQIFLYSDNFDQDIGGWNTESVEDLGQSFKGAVSFNQDIGAWDTSAVISMAEMFREASSFNQDLSGWCVANIASEPVDFDKDAVSWVLPRPVWGSCPL